MTHPRYMTEKDIGLVPMSFFYYFWICNAGGIAGQIDYEKTFLIVRRSGMCRTLNERPGYF